MTVDSVTQRPTRLRPDPFVAGGAVAGLAFGLVGQYVGTPWKTAGRWEVGFHDNGGWAALAALVGFVVVGALATTAFTAAARGREPGRTARRALGLAVVGVLSLVVFWTALPAVLAAGALGLAADARSRRGSTPPAAAVAVALAVLTVLSAGWLAVTG
ncbi:hypothetical protein ACI797_15835 [Geodermatophilus sp. SYSU D00691]